MQRAKVSEIVENHFANAGKMVFFFQRSHYDKIRGSYKARSFRRLRKIC